MPFVPKIGERLDVRARQLTVCTCDSRASRRACQHHKPQQDDESIWDVIRQEVCKISSFKIMANDNRELVHALAHTHAVTTAHTFTHKHTHSL